MEWHSFLGMGTSTWWCPQHQAVPTNTALPASKHLQSNLTAKKISEITEQ